MMRACIASSVLVTVLFSTFTGSAQTNSSELTPAQLMHMLEEHAERSKNGEHVEPLKLTAEMDAILVEQGILPPLDGTMTRATTNPAYHAPLQTVSINMQDVPLGIVLDTYSQFSGKAIYSDDGLSARITLAPTNRLTKAEALRLIEGALLEQGLVLTTVDNDSVRVHKGTQPAL